MKTITTTLIALTSSALLMAPAFAGDMHKEMSTQTSNTTEVVVTEAGVVDNDVTDIKTEADLFTNHINTATNQMKAGHYDTAYQQLNDAAIGSWPLQIPWRLNRAQCSITGMTFAPWRANF